MPIHTLSLGLKMPVVMIGSFFLGMLADSGGSVVIALIGFPIVLFGTAWSITSEVRRMIEWNEHGDPAE